MKKNRLFAVLAAVLLLGLCLALPALAEGKIPYAKVKLNKTSVVISPTGKAQLSLELFSPKNANDGAWMSSDESVATVDETGLVKANPAVDKTSTAKITFVSDGKSLAACKVTVKVIAVTKVKLNKTSLAISPNRTFKLTASALPANAAHREITWTSSDPTIVRVDPDGTLRPAGYGTTTVVASASNGKKAACKVKVTDVPVSKVAIKLSKLNVKPFQEAALTYTVTPELAKDTSLTWTSNKPEVVSVDSEGRITACGEGSATVTAIANDGSKKKDSIKITVKAVRVKTFAFAKNYSMYIEKGKSFRLETKVEPENASYRVPEFASSDESVLSVDKDGNVKALKGGTATVTVTVDGGRKKLKQEFFVCEGTPVTIKISAAGDVTLGGDPRQSKDDYKVETLSKLTRFKQYLEENGGDPGFVFKNVKSVFEQDDVSIINLEGPLTPSNSYSMTQRFVFRGNKTYAAALASGSIEAVSLANNKIGCCGNQGVIDTKNAIAQYTGGKTVWFDALADTAQQPCLIEKKGVTIGLIGFTMNANTTQIKNRLKRIRPYCDLLVVYFHWTNVEDTHKTTGDMMKLAHFVIDQGAELVLGAHQHNLAGIELYKGKTIVYGLGHLVHGGMADRDSMIYQQSFSVYDGFAIPKEYNIVPCATTDNRKELNKWQPVVLTDKAQIDALYKRLHSYSTEYEIPGI